MLTKNCVLSTCSAAFAILLLTTVTSQAIDWPAYGGDAGAMRYSPLAQINQKNVDGLVQAWVYRTGDMQRSEAALKRYALEVTPLMVHDRLLLCTPFNEVIALSPDTGKELWRFDPKISETMRPANQFVCRGVSYWQTQEPKPDKACQKRIFMGTNDARVFALDFDTGKPCVDFGDNGVVWHKPSKQLNWPGEYQITSPPAVVGDVVVVGSAISDNLRVDAPRGTVRAFDAYTGEQRWQFDAVPNSDMAQAMGWLNGSEKTTGHANVWAPMSVDEAADMVFLPTSSPSVDFYGGTRPGVNALANSVVALRGSTGELLWHFQTVHHDIWDYDLPTAPSLLDIEINGVSTPILVQGTKTGFIFVLNRLTGEPIFPVEEVAVPSSDVPGEWVSPTQPMPTKPPPLNDQHLTEDEVWGMFWFDRQACLKKFKASRSEGLFTPPSVAGTVLQPFTGGGVNWGGVAIDPRRGWLVVNTNNVSHIISLIPEAQVEQAIENSHGGEVAPQTGAPYGMRRELFLSPLDLPCNKPPWGLLTAVDLTTGEFVWQRRFGTVEDLAPIPLPWETGTPSLGGPIITAGDLVFIAAAFDNYLRAFAIETGDLLWQQRLPAGGQATPMTYLYKGKQYVLIAAGGNANAGTKLGDYIISYALP